MTARYTLAIRAATVVAAIAIQFTFPASADEALDVAIARGTQLMAAGKYEQAENSLRSALKSLDGASDVRLFTATANLGATFYYRGRLAEAEKTFHRAIEVWGALPGDSRPDASPVLSNLALVYLRTGQFETAEQTEKEVLALREQANGPSSVSVASALNTLAAIYQEQGRYTEAEAAARRSVRILSQAGESERFRLSVSLEQLAVIRQKQGDLNEADALLQRTETLCESMLDSSHPWVAEVDATIGALRLEQHRYDDAKRLLERAIGIWRDSNLSAPQVAAALNNLAQSHKRTGNYRAAEAFYAEAISMTRDTLGDQHPTYALFLGNFADLLRLEGRLRAAEKTYEKAIAVLDKRPGTYESDLADLRKELSLTRNMPAGKSARTVDVRQLGGSATH